MKLYKISLIGLAFLAGADSFAFRGQGYIEQSSSPQTFLSSFPGFFDTYLPPQGTLALEFPTLALDYGVTENWSIGSNGFAAIVTGLGQPIPYLKSRYRFFSNSQISSAITGYGSVFRFSDKEANTSNSGMLLGFTSNTSVYFPYNQILTFNFTALRFSVNGTQSSSLESQSSNIYALAPGMGYQIIPIQQLGFAFNFLFPVAFNASMNSHLASGNLDLLDSAQLPIAYQLMANLRTGSSSVLSLGVMGVRTANKGSNSLPFLTWTKGF